jgi:hypothetical protein
MFLYLSVEPRLKALYSNRHIRYEMCRQNKPGVKLEGSFITRRRENINTPVNFASQLQNQ